MLAAFDITGFNRSLPLLGAWVSLAFSSRLQIGASGTNPSIGLDSGWPIGEAAPYLWLLTPTYQDWLDYFTIKIDTISDFTSDRIMLQEISALTRKPWTILINSIPYEISCHQIGLARPEPRPAPAAQDQYHLNAYWVYEAPADIAATFTQVP